MISRTENKSPTVHVQVLTSLYLLT